MTLSVRSMAVALGVSKSQVARDKQDGMPMHDADAARAWRLQHRDLARSVDGLLGVEQPAGAAAPAPAAEPEADDGESGEYRQARATRERVNAERAQLELDQMRGRLIDVDEAARLAFTSFRAIRDAALNVPARIAAQAAAESDPLRVEQLVEAEISAALARFDPSKLLRDEDDEEEDGAAG